MRLSDFIVVAALLGAAWWHLTGGSLPSIVAPAPKATAATFVYEKDQHAVPGFVHAAMNKLNREKKIVATIIDDDVVDGAGEVPDQYKAAFAAAKEAGLPALVVLSGNDVLKVIREPKSEAEILEAVP